MADLYGVGRTFMLFQQRMYVEFVHALKGGHGAEPQPMPEPDEVCAQSSLCLVRDGARAVGLWAYREKMRGYCVGCQTVDVAGDGMRLKLQDNPDGTTSLRHADRCVLATVTPAAAGLLPDGLTSAERLYLQTRQAMEAKHG